MARRRKWLGVTATVAVLLAVLAAVVLVPRLGATFDGSPSKCAAAKIEAAEKKVAALLRCVRRAVAAGQTVSEACLVEAMSQFTSRFTAAESLGDCVTFGDVDTIEAKIDSFVEELMTELLPSDSED